MDAFTADAKCRIMIFDNTCVMKENLDTEQRTRCGIGRVADYQVRNHYKDIS